MGFVLADQAKQFTTLTPKDQKASILNSFTTVFGEEARTYGGGDTVGGTGGGGGFGCVRVVEYEFFIAEFLLNEQ